MAVNARWGQKLREALRAYEQRHDTRLSYSEIGRRVGARLKREPFASQSARAWFVEGQEPESFAVAEAIASVLEADPGALAFEPQPKRGTPHGVEPDPTRDRRLTDAELDAADRIAGRKQPGEKRRRSHG